MERIASHGWPNNVRLFNGDAELIITLDVGPRIISYRVGSGPNVLKEYPEMLGKSGEAEWQIRGGHRMWIAPEDTTRTYFPDNNPVAVSEVSPGVYRFTPPPETIYGVQKVLQVALAPSGSRVEITHFVENVGTEPTCLAPWGPTVMAPGGLEIIPLPPKRPHPGHPRNCKTPNDFGPNQTMIVWPYTDFRDSRWSFGSRYVTLRQDAQKGPTKIGFAHKLGWVAYLNREQLFIKRFGYVEGALYPDGGNNYQTFSNEDMLEMETVGILETVAPGAVVELRESWELFGNVTGTIASEDDIDRIVLPWIR